MSASATSPLSEQPSIGSNLINIFIAPRKVFEGFKTSATWGGIVVAFLVLAAGTVLFSYSAAQKVGFEQISKNQIQSNPKAMERMEQATPEQRAQQMEISVKITRVISYMFSVILAVVLTIYALILLGTFNFVMGQSLGFKQVMAVVFWSHIPGVLHGILAAITLWAGADPEAFNIQNPVATNPGFLVSQVDHPALYAFLSGFDIFQIWTMTLVALGISVVSRVKFSTAFMVVTVLFLLRVIASVIPALF
jgi:hypothetical protein